MFHIDQSATILYIQHLQEMVFYLSVILIINISLCDYKSELSESNEMTYDKVITMLYI